jgi:outer membrane lipoprotein carrier protein
VNRQSWLKPAEQGPKEAGVEGILMKKRELLLISLFFVMFSDHCFALTTRQVVKRVQERYEQICSLTADFTQESSNKMLDQTQRTKGKVCFQKGGLMRWKYTTSPENVWVSDGKTLWFYQPEENQVIVQKVDDERGTLFLGFVVGEGDLARDFEIQGEDDEVSETERGYRVVLTPKQPHAMMDRLILEFDRKTCYVRQAEVYDAYDNLTRTRFSRIRVNRKLAEDLFTFEIPPGTEVIENPSFSTP